MYPWCLQKLWGEHTMVNLYHTCSQMFLIRTLNSEAVMIFLHLHVRHWWICNFVHVNCNILFELTKESQLYLLSVWCNLSNARWYDIHQQICGCTWTGVSQYRHPELKNFPDLQNQYIIVTGTLPFHESIYGSGTLNLVCTVNLNSYFFFYNMTVQSGAYKCSVLL